MRVESGKNVRLDLKVEGPSPKRPRPSRDELVSFYPPLVCGGRYPPLKCYTWGAVTDWHQEQLIGRWADSDDDRGSVHSLEVSDDEVL